MATKANIHIIIRLSLLAKGFFICIKPSNISKNLFSFRLSAPHIYKGDTNLDTEANPCKRVLLHFVRPNAQLKTKKRSVRQYPPATNKRFGKMRA